MESPCLPQKFGFRSSFWVVTVEFHLSTPEVRIWFPLLGCSCEIPSVYSRSLDLGLLLWYSCGIRLCTPEVWTRFLAWLVNSAGGLPDNRLMVTFQWPRQPRLELGFQPPQRGMLRHFCSLIVLHLFSKRGIQVLQFYALCHSFSSKNLAFLVSEIV